MGKEFKILDSWIKKKSKRGFIVHSSFGDSSIKLILCDGKKIVGEVGGNYIHTMLNIVEKHILKRK